MKSRKHFLFGLTTCAALLLTVVSGRAQQEQMRSATDERPAPSASGKPAKSADVAAVQPKKEPTASELASYRIGEQDVLMITVWKEPELSGPVIVRPDGKVTVPLINEISVVGMTPEQLQTTLTDKLLPFLTVPQVTVTVREINSRKVYVIGQVGREGSYRINGATTVLQIIAEAGGLRDFANRKRIYVLRNENGKQLRFPFNYEEVVRGKNNAQNIVLIPGDTVLVP